MKKQNGITLVALIITIIVMLILVGVSITVSLNGGLFNTAEQARDNTIEERDRELGLSDGKVEINGEEYDSIDEYVNGVKEYKIGDEVTVGDEVKVKGENFYVIADDAEKVTLLAKYNLKADGSAQDKTKENTRCAFSSAGGFTAEENLNNNSTLKADTTSAVYKAMQYGATLGGTGRLMTKGEAETLQTNNPDIFCGTYTSEGLLSYWLGSACNTTNVYIVVGSRNWINNVSFDYYAGCGVRPVVEISKSAI